MIEEDKLYYSSRHGLIMRYVGGPAHGYHYFEVLYDNNVGGIWKRNFYWGCEFADYYVDTLKNKISGMYWLFFNQELNNLNLTEVKENNVILGDVMFTHYDTIMEMIHAGDILPVKLKTKFKMG
jgi:hypothetical protein